MLVISPENVEEPMVPLQKLRHFVPPKTLTSVYRAIFNSHLNYGNQIWGQKQNSIRNRIFILQKKCYKYQIPFFINLNS